MLLSSLYILLLVLDRNKYQIPGQWGSKHYKSYDSQKVKILGAAICGQQNEFEGTFDAQFVIRKRLARLEYILHGTWLYSRI